MGYAKKNKKWDYKKLFFLVLTVSWVSGLTFFLLNNFMTIPGEFGEEKHPWQYNILKIHGASSFLIMVVFGYFISAHVKKSWYARSTKPIMGIILLVMPIISMITGYALYYIVADFARVVVIYIHLGIGFFIPFVLITHIFHMTRETRNGKACRQKIRQSKL